MKIDLVSELIYSLLRNEKEKSHKAFLACIANEPEGRVKQQFKYMYNEFKEREGMAVIEQLDYRIKNLVGAPYRECGFDDLFLTEEIQQKTKEILLEWQHRDMLLENGLAPCHKILLEGPSGNGKTSYAIALAKALGVPLLVTNSSLVLDSLLGQSEKNVTLLFRNMPKECVLFFDEFEALAASRSKEGDSGTTKAWNSVVTSFLVNMEQLRHSVVFVAATNRVDALDKAVIRRFDVQMRFQNPTEEEKQIFIDRYLVSHDLQDKALFYQNYHLVPELEKAVSFSNMERYLRGWHKGLLIQQLLEKENHETKITTKQ